MVKKSKELTQKISDQELNLWRIKQDNAEKRDGVLSKTAVSPIGKLIEVEKLNYDETKRSVPNINNSGSSSDG